MDTGKKMFCTLALAACVALPATPAGAMDASDAPEQITIDSLANLYGPVEFDHAMHADLMECADCHHHTTGQPTQDANCLRCHQNSEEADSVACADCHSSERFHKDYLQTLSDPNLYHMDKPGLKGAYHLACVSCHQEVGVASGCRDCHVMSEKGEELFHTGPHAPDPGGHNTGGH